MVCHALTDITTIHLYWRNREHHRSGYGKAIRVREDKEVWWEVVSPPRNDREDTPMIPHNMAV